MSFIKKNYTLLTLLLVVVLMIGGFFYYKGVLTPQLEELQGLQSENEVMQGELNFLNKEYLVLGQRKKELKDINMETKSLEDQVPTYETSAIMMSELIQYTDIYDFGARSVEVGQVLAEAEETQDYKTIPFTIEYRTTYENTVKFLEMINRSYNMITIDSYHIDNAVQEKATEVGMTSISKDTVDTQLVLNMHFRESDAGEVYPNSMAYLEKEERIFERPLQEDIIVQSGEVWEDPEVPTQTQGSTSSSQPKAATTTAFNIHLADILRSGDNYSVSGYSPDEDPVYVGLTSSKDTKIVLTIRDNSYTCLIEDSEGNKNEKSIDTQVISPSINITSQIQNVMELMPTASIHVRNYTPKVININLRGTSLENVMIYNENNELVKPGTQSGKIAVTR